jgi:hypothetical protein
MLPKEIVDEVRRRVSGISARDAAVSISSYHRIQVSPGFHDAVVALKGEIEKVSDASTKIYSYAQKGNGKIETWEDLYGWNPFSATLELVEPEKKMLADFLAEPISLAAFSKTVDFEGEVVDVGKGLSDEDFGDKDLKGKAVLTTGRGSVVHRTACIDRGAAGILTFIPPAGKDEIGHIRRYEGLWPRPGEAKQTGFGFALTQSDGLQMKKLLEEGKSVKIRAKIDAEIGEGVSEILSAVIEGKDKSTEVWVMAHICHPHPGANDNASGSGALYETLRVLSQLMKNWTLEKPEVSIRFLWVPEWHGTIKFIDQEQDLLKRCKFVINVDMVGADPCKSGSSLNLHRTPYSLETSLNNVVAFWLESEAKQKRNDSEGGSMTPLPWSSQAYSGGSDHLMFIDSTIGIPAVMLNQYPDKFYHTSTDTADKLCSRQMGYASRVVTLSIITLAYPKLAVKETLQTHCRDEYIKTMLKVGRDGVKILAECLEDPDEAYPRIMRWLSYSRDAGLNTLEKMSEEWNLISEQKALLEALKTSIEMGYTTEMVVARKAYEGACAEIGLEAKEEHLPDIDAIGLEVEVKRTFRYALAPSFFMNSLSDKRPEYEKIRETDPQIYNRMDELFNLANDWTKLSDIWDRVCYQFGPIDSKTFLKVVNYLKEMGLIEMREA